MAEEKRDSGTQEYLWTSEANWTCPHCRTVNFAIREFCRGCGYDSNCGEFPWYNPLPPYEGLPR
jgi:hypothetical protein